MIDPGTAQNSNRDSYFDSSDRFRLTQVKVQALEKLQAYLSLSCTLTLMKSSQAISTLIVILLSHKASSDQGFLAVVLQKGLGESLAMTLGTSVRGSIARACSHCDAWHLDLEDAFHMLVIVHEEVSVAFLS